MADKPIDNQRLVAKIDKAISELETDIRLISIESPSVSSEAKAFSDQMRTNYADATRRIVLGDERGSSDLETILASISERRAKLLNAVLSNMTERVRATVTNPLWFGNQHSFLDQLEEINTYISKLQSEIDDSTELANGLREQVSKALDLAKRLEQERRRAQYRIPLRVLQWGIPILIGIFISGKFDLMGNLISTGVLLTVAIVSYIAVRGLKLERPIRLRFPVWRHIGWFGTMGVVYIVVIVVVAVGMLLPDYLAERPLHLEIGPLPTTVAQGSEFELPYTIKYASQEMIFDVNLEVDAPGLVPDKPVVYNALGDQEETGKIRIAVPQTIPDGPYPIKVKWYLLNKLG